MSISRKTLLSVAASGLATWIFIQSPSAQIADRDAIAKSAMEKAVTEMGVQSKSSGAAHDKADAAMVTPSSFPTEADKKADAAMAK
jgi:hypothetical protein